jgi:hypothetical protein
MVAGSWTIGREKADDSEDSVPDSAVPVNRP